MTGNLTGPAAFASVFGAGVLASLSPCVYPLIPVTLGFFGTQVGRRRAFNVLSYALGQTLAFVALGAAAVFAGEALGFSSESPAANIGVGLILLVAGAVSLYGRIPAFITGPATAVSRALRFGRGQPAPAFAAETKAPVGRLAGLLGAFALGAGSAIVASPCTSPILASVLALMAGHTTLTRGLALMFCYAVGFSSLFVALGLGAERLPRLPRSGPWMVRLHRTGAVALLLMGGYYCVKSFL